MSHNLQTSVALLGRTPAALNALLRDLPDEWTRKNEGGKTWSAFDTVGHLVYCERADWMPRAKMILEFGEARVFEPFDREGFTHERQDAPIAERLDNFAHLRAANLDELRTWNLQPKDFERRGNHPSLGVVTLSQLLATWAAHDLTHIHQVSRVMAHQYREAVGPWSEHLGVLKCGGHSS